MFNSLINVLFLDNLIIEAEFQSGEIKQYDFKDLFEKYPIFKRLEIDKLLFNNGKIAPGGSGIIFDDELDIAAEEIYSNGKLAKCNEVNDINVRIANVISKARLAKGLTQKELANITKIHQAEISKIERGIGNPSVKTLDRIAKGLNLNLMLSLK